MAKISFNKLTPIKSVDPTIVTIGENEITVERYLPMADKAAFVERVLNAVIDDTGFINPMRLDVMFHIELIKTYTNISITDKMMENPSKVYEDLMNDVGECAKHTVDYLYSFAGMIKNVVANYDATKMNVEEIMKTLDDPEKIGLVKDVLDKIG